MESNMRFINKVFALALVLIVLPITTVAQQEGGNGCAIHLEGEYDFSKQIAEMGCTAGYPIMFYNYASTGKWNVILPIRVAAMSVCDMAKPISETGTVGSKPFQSVMCTYSGEIRKIKVDKDHRKGWEWGNI